MPKISVIVPVYKVEAYLNRCVDSILGQTYADFQLILVDDGSPDNCGSICDAYARQDRRIHVLHQENGGLSAARNAGIDWVRQNTGSTWLTFVDSDDWLHPDFLGCLLNAAEQTGCQISACGFYHTEGAPIPEGEDTSVACLSADEYYCSDEYGNATPAACGKLYHSMLFSQLRYPVGRLHEDEFTTYRALYQAGRIAVTPARLYAYFQNQQGITHSQWNPKRMDVLEAFEQQMAFAQETGNELLLKKVAEAYLFTAYEQLAAAAPAYRGQLRQKLRTAIKLQKTCGNPSGYVRIHWAYEAAWPCKPLWWIVGKIKG